MLEPLKNRTNLRKKLFFKFLGANFVAPKSLHRREKQSVLGPASKIFIVHLSIEREQALKCFFVARPVPTVGDLILTDTLRLNLLVGVNIKNQSNPQHNCYIAKKNTTINLHDYFFNTFFFTTTVHQWDIIQESLPERKILDIVWTTEFPNSLMIS